MKGILTSCKSFPKGEEISHLIKKMRNVDQRALLKFISMLSPYRGVGYVIFVGDISFPIHLVLTILIRISDYSELST